jgi:pimeloyl-ACP methyl ester carboxylesterase
VSTEVSVALHTRELGQGAPVLLVHSSGMASRQWRKLMERLAPQHRVIAPDLLGSGDNPPWPANTPFDFHQDLDALCTLFDSLGAPAHVVGHSYGGFLAILLARLRAERVRSLALYDAVAFGVLYDVNDVDGLADLARVDHDAAFLDEKTGGDALWFERFVDYWNGTGAWRALPPPARDGFLRVGRKVFYEVKTLLDDRTPLAAYDVIRAPTLILTGQHTPLAARRVNALLAASLPNARLEVIAGAGHMGPLTHADQVNALIETNIALGDG